ncbi:MAG: (2Fe-2S)-binding protein [Planctomycetota bacterium]
MLICHCFRITAAQMETLIREEGLTTVEQVSDRTGACKGCMTCYIDIVGIIERVNAETDGDGDARESSAS